MNMEVFAARVCAAVGKNLGGGVCTEVKKVRKNNGILLHGLMISSEGQTVVPTIYLESYLEACESGTPFEEVICSLLAIYQKGTPQGNIDMEFFRHYGAVKDKICYRLIGRKGNEALLDEMPHVDFLDMAICFYYAYQGETLGEGSILIHNSHMEMWKVSVADLLAVARENTPQLLPWECSGIKEILNELEGADMDGSGLEMGDGMEESSQEFPMKILSNKKKLYGASCILYPGVLEEIAGEGKSLYIIPSSMHETILLPYDKVKSAVYLKMIIYEMNRTQVAPEEVLSDSLYYYDSSRKEVVLA